MSACVCVCVYFVYCQLSVSVSIERKKAKRTAHAGCWWSNAQCCCLIKSRMREYYFALPQSWRRCFCCCCCCLRYGAAAIAATVDVVSCLCVCVCNSRTQQQPVVCVAVSFASCFLHRAFRSPIHAHTFTCTHTLHILFAQFSLTGFLCYKTGRHHQPTDCNKKLAQWCTKVNVSF